MRQFGGYAALLLALLAASSRAVERRPGVIRLNNGQEHKGEVFFKGNPPRIYEGDGAAKGRYVNLEFAELASLSFFVRKESAERPWRFKNAGSDEKEYLEGEYPVLELGVEAKLKGGQTLKGHLMNLPVYIRTPDGENPMDYLEQKFHLKFQIQGEVGQKAGDLAWVKEIVFVDIEEAAPAAGFGAIEGAFTAMGIIEQVAAYGIDRKRSYEGRVLDAAKGTYRIADLPPDRYDVAVLTERGIWVGLSAAAAATKEPPRPLEAGDEARIAEEVVKFRDFFDEQQVLGVQGHREAAKVMVHQRRVKAQHDEKGLEGKEVQRLDVWTFYMSATQWHIDARGRANLFRYFEPRGGTPRPIVLRPELGACQVDPAQAKITRLDFAAAEAGK
ncbi:MAG: hypothetical protein M5U26_19935 [Planctomycetota bacterium]|nr:hypothetical protein [Planctomycetota bacterium]